MTKKIFATVVLFLLTAVAVAQNATPNARPGASEAEFRAKPVTDAKTVKSVIEKFREKYGAADVKEYYSKFDVAVVVDVD